jgi:hypothetical protein
MNPRRELPPASRSQTLVTGVYRSGTEFVTHCLNGHPALSATMYRVNALRFVAGRYDLPVGPTAGPVDGEQLERAVRDLAGRITARYGAELDAAVVLELLEGYERPGHVCAIYDAAMRALYLGGGVEHWAEKNQLLWREVPLFLEGMAEGRAILVLRDPRAVLASFKRFTYAPPPAYLGAAFNCLDAMLHADELTREHPGRVLVLRYEDAAREPLAEARRAWRFLGLDDAHPLSPRETWKDAYGEPWRGNTTDEGTGENTGHGFDLERALARGAELAPEELALVEGLCGGLMRRFGYAPETRAEPHGRGWERAVSRMAGNAQLEGFLEHWRATGRGAQEFPTDPLDPKNWRRRGKEAFHGI